MIRDNFYFIKMLLWQSTKWFYLQCLLDHVTLRLLPSTEFYIELFCRHIQLTNRHIVVTKMRYIYKKKSTKKEKKEWRKGERGKEKSFYNWNIEKKQSQFDMSTDLVQVEIPKTQLIVLHQHQKIEQSVLLKVELKDLGNHSKRQKGQ